MGEIPLKKALDDYKSIYMAYRNFTDRTRVEYQNDLEAFLEYAAKSGIVWARDVGLSIVQRFVASLEEKGLSSLTRKRKVVVIRSFLSFLYQDGYITGNIASRIVLPFTETSTPHVLTQTECDRLRATCTGSPRDAAIIELLFQTGVRLSELIHVTLDDIDLGNGREASEKNNGFIRISGERGRKDRVLPLSAKTLLALRSYLDIRRSGKSTLFLNRFGEPLGKRGMQKILRKHLKKAHIQGASINTIRHTFGAHFGIKCASTKVFKEVMGYKDARSAAIYIALGREMSRELRANTLR